MYVDASFRDVVITTGYTTFAKFDSFLLFDDDSTSLPSIEEEHSLPGVNSGSLLFIEGQSFPEVITGELTVHRTRTAPS